MPVDPNQLSMFVSKEDSQKRIVFFDVETKKSADEVGGWNHIADMGCAVAVCYDSIDEKYFVYEEHELHLLIEQFLKADLIVGFNHLRFDHKVLQVYTQIKLAQLPNFDMLDDITKILGHRVSLDALASATLKKKKSANGLQSLAWVKEGKINLVKEYCQKDVEVTKDLFLFGASKGYVLFEKNGQVTQVQVNWSMENVLS